MNKNVMQVIKLYNAIRASLSKIDNTFKLIKVSTNQLKIVKISDILEAAAHKNKELDTDPSKLYHILTDYNKMKNLQNSSSLYFL